MMYQVQALSTLLVVLTIYLTYSCEGSRLPCKPCIGLECDIEPEDCRHGTARDICGRLVCAKGPGQRCGGPSNILGTCGEGMHCKCDRCAGCSLHTLECDLSEFLCLK